MTKFRTEFRLTFRDGSLNYRQIDVFHEWSTYETDAKIVQLVDRHGVALAMVTTSPRKRSRNAQAKSCASWARIFHCQWPMAKYSRHQTQIGASFSQRQIHMDIILGGVDYVPSRVAVGDTLCIRGHAGRYRVWEDWFGVRQIDNHEHWCGRGNGRSLICARPNLGMVKCPPPPVMKSSCPTASLVRGTIYRMPRSCRC